MVVAVVVFAMAAVAMVAFTVVHGDWPAYDTGPAVRSMLKPLM
jgi:hypothetical protein